MTRHSRLLYFAVQFVAVTAAIAWLLATYGRPVTMVVWP